MDVAIRACYIRIFFFYTVTRRSTIRFRCTNVWGEVVERAVRHNNTSALRSIRNHGNIESKTGSIDNAFCLRLLLTLGIISCCMVWFIKICVRLKCRPRAAATTTLSINNNNNNVAGKQRVSHSVIILSSTPTILCITYHVYSLMFYVVFDFSNSMLTTRFFFFQMYTPDHLLCLYACGLKQMFKICLARFPVFVLFATTAAAAAAHATE